MIGIAKVLYNWRHEGEEFGARIFPHKNGVAVGLVTGEGLILSPLLYRSYAFSLLWLLQFSYAIATSRRAIILTRNEVIFRPPLGRVRRVEFKFITRLAHTKMAAATAFISPMIIAALSMDLLGGITLNWRLDVENAHDLLQALSEDTGKKIDN
jgi:hypothetical protein